MIGLSFLPTWGGCCDFLAGLCSVLLPVRIGLVSATVALWEILSLLMALVFLLGGVCQWLRSLVTGLLMLTFTFRFSCHLFLIPPS